MRLLEYEAKILLKQAGITVPRSSLVRSPTNRLALPVVLKSQVPTGGRGKAGGIQIITHRQDLPSAIKTLFSLPIKAHMPKVILAEELVKIKHEYYLSLLINKSSARIELMAHRSGGVEVEENDPDSFFVAPLDGKNSQSVGEQLAGYFDLPHQSFALQDMVKQLYALFIKKDALLIEINPLILTTNNNLVAGDGKIELDNAAAFRHSEWQFEALLPDNNFVSLNQNGTIATIANGAGLAMATVDAVKSAGMRPANFLDIGGGATAESIAKAFNKLLEFPHVRAIVINIFAGITRCDEVARAIITAKQAMATLPPLCIRLAGTNFEEAVALLAQENIPTLATLEECLQTAKREVDG